MKIMSKAIHKVLLSKSVNKFTHANNLFIANGVLYLTKSEDDLFKHMVRLVCSQQLSLKAANTIWGKIIHQVEYDNLSLADACNKDYAESLRECGLSGNKVKALQGLKLAFDRGDISNEMITESSHSQILELVCNIWGFGPWSGDMIAMFYCALPDVWSDGDLILNKGIKKLTKKQVATPNEFLRHFSPFKSYLALHIWKGKNMGLL